MFLSLPHLYHNPSIEGFQYFQYKCDKRLDTISRLWHPRVVSQLNPIFQSILDAHLNRKPAGSEASATTKCDSCGAPSTHAVYDPGDASVGYGDSFVEMCDECDPTK